MGRKLTGQQPEAVFMELKRRMIMSDIHACANFNCFVPRSGTLVPFAWNAFVPPIIPDLSYQEQYAGFHDVDGKKVYTKLVDLGQLFDAIPSQTKLVDPQIPNLLNIVDLKVRRYTNNGENIVFGNLSRPEPKWEVSFYIARNQIAIQVYGNASNRTAIAQIYYTCTDR